jgi:hypothetical protein
MPRNWRKMPAMRRLLRILLNVATVLSLVLCAATMAAWVRSYLVRDEIAWSLANPRLELDLFTYRGGLIAGVLAPNEFLKYLPNPGARWEQRAPETYAGAGGSQGTFFNHFGFAFAHAQYPFDHRFLASPYWFILLLTAIQPGARLVGWRRRARRLRMRPGLCRHCGYDCRATPNRCPECGTAR